MILPFSLSKPQRNGGFFIKRLFVVYQSVKLSGIQTGLYPRNGILGYNNR